MVGIARGQKFEELILGRVKDIGCPHHPYPNSGVGMGVMGYPFAQPGRMSLYLSSDPYWSMPCKEGAEPFLLFLQMGFQWIHGYIFHFTPLLTSTGFRGEKPLLTPRTLPQVRVELDQAAEAPGPPKAEGCCSLGPLALSSPFLPPSPLPSLCPPRLLPLPCYPALLLSPAYP